MITGSHINSIRQRQPVLRPGFARWMWDRDLGLREVADAVGCSYEQVRRICLPFGDANRRVPDQALITRIHELTCGEIGVQHWYPSELQPPGPAGGGDPVVLQRARAM